MSADARAEINAALDELPDANLQALAVVVRKLRSGPPIRRWSAAIGTLTDTEAEDMRQAVEESCERVDHESW